MDFLAFTSSKIRSWAFRAPQHATTLAVAASFAFLTPSIAICDFQKEPCDGATAQISVEQLEPAVPNVVNNGLTVFQQIEPQLKSDFELDEYLMKHLKFGDGLLNWMRYKVSIREAAEAFQIPFPFLACLLAKESRFESQSVSRKKARDLGQLTPETQASISRILAKKADDPSQLPEHWGELQSSWQKLWKENWQIESNDKIAKSEVSRPLYSIAGAALWARYHFLLQAKRMTNMTDVRNLDTLEMLSASYNMGDHGFLIKCGNSSSAAECRKLFQVGGETAQQMWSVRTCMEHGNDTSLFVRMPSESR